MLGAVLVGWNLVETYYLVTGRVVPGPEQPPLAVVLPFLAFGAILMLGGYFGSRSLKKRDDGWEI